MDGAVFVHVLDVELGHLAEGFLAAQAQAEAARPYAERMERYSHLEL